MNTIEITDQNFSEEVLQSKIPVLLDFWASWCAPCRTMTPVIEEIAQEFLGQIKVGKVDVDQNPEISNGIRAVPTFRLYIEGVHVSTLVGAMLKDSLTMMIKAQIGK